jgi:hypothetical protein
MNEFAQGIATAALILQSVLLQALIRKGVLSLDEALGIVDLASLTVALKQRRMSRAL